MRRLFESDPHSLATATVLRGVAPLLAACTVKSSNPLRPTVAGPNRGRVHHRAQAAGTRHRPRVRRSHRAVTLLIENASTNGERPIWLQLEVATRRRVFERGSTRWSASSLARTAAPATRCPSSSRRAARTSGERGPSTAPTPDRTRPAACSRSTVRAAHRGAGAGLAGPARGHARAVSRARRRQHGDRGTPAGPCSIASSWRSTWRFAQMVAI